MQGEVVKKNTGMTAIQLRRLTYAALYLAIALALPFVTGQIPEIGAMLCPMHIPVLLCGFLCGWPWGLAVGLIAPPLRSVLFGMPAMFPTAAAMMFELMTYGAVAGRLYRAFVGKKLRVVLALVPAMIAGRLAWGAAQLAFTSLTHETFTWALFLGGAVVNAIPGIILQLILVPAIVVAMEKAGLSLNGPFS